MKIIVPASDTRLMSREISASNAVSPVATSLQQTWRDMMRTGNTTASQRQVDMTIALVEACSQANEIGWD